MKNLTKQTGAQKTFEADTTLSRLEWTGKKIGGAHSGTIAVSSGKIAYEDGKITGDLEIDMNSISVTDLSGEWKEKLEDHLRSEDFFATAQFPKAEFKLLSVEPKGPGRYAVTGDLTIKDHSHTIRFDAEGTVEEHKMTFSGEAVIDRSKFDVRYGSRSFFASIGDKMIHDEFTVRFNFIEIN